MVLAFACAVGEHQAECSAVLEWDLYELWGVKVEVNGKLGVLVQAERWNCVADQRCNNKCGLHGCAAQKRGDLQPLRETFTPTCSMQSGHAGHTATLLPSGSYNGAAA
jgi:hypothetical protein